MSQKRSRRTALKNPVIPKHQAEAQAGSTQYRIGKTRDLARSASMKFLMPIRGVEEECFVINYRGRYFAYVNRCRHIPMPMDWVDNQFFAEHGRYLMCQTHNAYYQPDTGECVAGPSSACGKFLYQIPVRIREGVIYADAPDYGFDDDY